MPLRRVVGDVECKPSLVSFLPKVRVRLMEWPMLGGERTSWRILSGINARVREIRKFYKIDGIILQRAKGNFDFDSKDWMLGRSDRY